MRVFTQKYAPERHITTPGRVCEAVSVLFILFMRIIIGGKCKLPEKLSGAEPLFLGVRRPEPPPSFLPMERRNVKRSAFCNYYKILPFWL